MRWRERDGVRWLEAELPGAVAAFSARSGGASAGRYAGLNLGLVTNDDPQRVRRNRAVLAAALELDPAKVLTGLQVHGADVARNDLPLTPSPFLGGGEPQRADGQATSAKGLAPLVFVADCLPIALSGPRGVAMLHAGWRGLSAGVIARGVGEVDAAAAVIGPGIGRCCFEAGEEVHARFSGLGGGIADGRMLDLPEVAARLLAQAGVEDVERTELCTSCEPGLFFSHRRDEGKTGRQAGVVWS